MIPLFLLVGCNLSYIVDLFAALHELSLSQKNTKMLKTKKTTLTTPAFFDFKSFFLPDYTRFENLRKFYRRKLKKIEIKAKKTSKSGDV